MAVDRAFASERVSAASQVIWYGLVLRLVIATWNGFLGPSFGADGDALGLHQMAIDFTQGTFPVTFRVNYLYPYLLGHFYSATVPSVFLGGVVSCFGWLASAQPLLASMRLLKIPARAQQQAMLVYALLPSSVLWTGVTLREPFQALAVNLLVFAALMVGLRDRHRYWLLLIGATALGAVLHATLLGWGIVMMLVVAVWEVSKRPRLMKPLPIAIGAVTVVVGAWLAYRLFIVLFSYPVDRGLAFAVESYQRSGLNIGVRTDYRESVSIEDNLDLLAFVPVALWQYLFEPMPWKVSALPDLVSLAENILRGVLIAQALQTVPVVGRRRRGAVVVIVAAYLILETAWAIGTFNWGTAARHHIPGIGVLAMAAYASQRRRRLVAGPSHPFATTVAA